MTEGYVLVSYIAGYGVVAAYVVMLWRRLRRARRESGGTTS